MSEGTLPALSPIVQIPNGDPGVTYRDVVGFPGYAVGDDGSIWCCRTTRCVGLNAGSVGYVSNRWRRLKGDPNHQGKLRVILCNNGIKSRQAVHRIVLETFVGPCPPGMQACHFPDRDPANNRLSNLRWGTPTDNAADRDAHGMTARGSRHGCATIDDARARAIKQSLLAGGMTHRDIAQLHGTTVNVVDRISTGQTWRHI